MTEREIITERVMIRKVNNGYIVKYDVVEKGLRVDKTLVYETFEKLTREIKSILEGKEK